MTFCFLRAVLEGIALVL
ncbi:hypothetical protein QQP08_004397 [Theobroma cacao]|nr:hypothetical protein QQP08_004397 [Theobroma cacao]